MSEVYYARITDKDGITLKQLLTDHLQGVAHRASAFAAQFDSADWGQLAGMWHDLGKYQQCFQDKLAGAHINVEHSGIGAALAFQKFNAFGLPIAYVIAGHHTGLANRVESGPDLPLPLMDRINANINLAACSSNSMPADILDQQLPSLAERFSGAASMNKTRNVEFWIRFLFSCLIDADRLDAEFFDEPTKSQLRSVYASITELNTRLDQYLINKVTAIPVELSDSPVNNVRRIVLEQCRTEASNTPGIFSINVPTGGGKTLSAMAFALKHAGVNNLKRVIVVIPYTSIIEQNAAEYKYALGEENVIEHHSSYDPYNGKSDIDTTRYQLATENWDAPIIVTTSVQFFETLFSSRPSMCRKLHNIANSVIILDEVQTLPPGFLASILEALNELVVNYGCSILLSTATPPALSERPDFKQGLKGVRSIIGDPQELANKLKRVEYSWPEPSAEPMTWPSLSYKIAFNRQVLAIVDRRKDARELTRELVKICQDDSVFHLSALMCPAHRIFVIKQIKQHLKANNPCRVVSTQVVEAGVDLDFPIVYRATAGLSSIIQAAGRCNREGQLEKGRLIVFKPPHEPPIGVLRTAKQITESMLEIHGHIDPDRLLTIEDFFKQLYFTQDLDASGVQIEREQLNYANVGRNFQLIDDGFTRNVVVPYCGASNIIAAVKQVGLTRNISRRLQPYTVSIYPDSFYKLERTGAIEEIADNLFTISDLRYYDSLYGLSTGDESMPLETLVI